MTPLKELLESINNGVPEAVDELVLRYSYLIEKECSKFGILQHPELSHSDLFQEVVLRVWTRLGQFRGINEPAIVPLFENWLRTTARSVLANIGNRQNAKKRKPEKPIARFEAATEAYTNNVTRTKTASSIFLHKEQSERLLSMIKNNLDGESRKILMLRIVEGKSLKQIAEQAGLTYDQVRYRYEAAVKKLESSLM